MNEAEFEAKFTDFCKTASEPAFHILIHGLLKINAKAKEVECLENSYRQRFDRPFTRKELTSSANEVSH